MPTPFADRYREAMRQAGGACPIESGVLGRLADHECAHGRLPGDRTRESAAAGRRRTHPSSHSAGGRNRNRRPPDGRPPDQGW